MANKKSMNVLILCGGKGIRLSGDSAYIPKAMVRVGERPMIWHVMKRYALFGYSKFTLALGTKGEMIRDYFLNYESYTNNIRIKIGDSRIKNLTSHQESGWDVTMVDTGELANTGARIARCKDYIDTDEFMVTYSDSVGNIDFDKLIGFHRSHKKIGTITGVIPPFREKEFSVKDGIATEYFNVEKAKVSERYINGGFMVFTKKLFSYLTAFNECRLEDDVLGHLIQDKQLSVYPHHKFWHWLDTERDYQHINKLADKNKMYWLQK